MILSIITFILVGLTFWNGIRFFLDEPKLFKQIYFDKLKDYFWAFLLFLGTITTLSLLSMVELPSFLKFSWIKLLGGTGTNLIANPGLTEGTSTFALIGTIIFYLCLIAILPYLAKMEELSFRSQRFSVKDRVISSIKFGFIHMIVGVPVFAAILLCFIGYIFSFRYKRAFYKYYEQSYSYDRCENEAIDSATSLHAKFNFIIISLLLITISILHFAK